MWTHSDLSVVYIAFIPAGMPPLSELFRVYTAVYSEARCCPRDAHGWPAVITVSSVFIMLEIINAIVDGVILRFLEISYTLIPNYGIGIILLTVLVKVLFYPLTKKQFQAMTAMKALQPQLQAIQKKYKSDPKQLQIQMMQLYKDHKVNPLSGCLPILVQLPIFFAIFHGINSPMFDAMTHELGAYSGFVPYWITDLTQPDPIWLLPILVGASTYLSQKLMPVNPQQQKVMAFLPIIMIVISARMPAGVLLYWAASQLIATLQQWLVMQKANGDKPALLTSS